jgi:hypothetical protein
MHFDLSSKWHIGPAVDSKGTRPGMYWKGFEMYSLTSSQVNLHDTAMSERKIFLWTSYFFSTTDLVNNSFRVWRYRSDSYCIRGFRISHIVFPPRICAEYPESVNIVPLDGRISCDQNFCGSIPLPRAHEDMCLAFVIILSMHTFPGLCSDWKAQWLSYGYDAFSQKALQDTTIVPLHQFSLQG